jgi:hypothetical protein
MATPIVPGHRNRRICYPAGSGPAVSCEVSASSAGSPTRRHSPLPPAGSNGPGTQRLQRSWNESIKAAASGPTRASSRSTKDAPSRSNSVPRQASGTIQSWKSGARSSPYLTKRHWYNHRPFGKEKNDYPERPLVRVQSRVSPARDSGRRYPVVFHTLVWSSLAGGYAAIGSRCWPASAAVVCPGHEMHPGLPR